MPSAVAIAICTTAPGMAIRFTASRSRSEKCRPTPNISSITPISDNCAGQMNIGDEARRAGADDDAGDEVADQGGNLDAFGQEAKHEGDAEAGGDGW